MGSLAGERYISVTTFKRKYGRQRRGLDLLNRRSPGPWATIEILDA